MRLQPDGPQPEHTSATDDANNARVLMLTGVSLAVVGTYASMHPAEISLAIFSMILTWAAIGSGFVALVLSHRIFAPRLNLWDKSMMLLLAALVTGAMVDTAAVTAFIQANAPAAAGAIPAAEGLGAKP